MKLFAALLVLALNSCQVYRERFTFYGDDGVPDHEVDVFFASFGLVGEAGKLSTETQTEEFIRTVNADNLRSRPDAETVGAVSNGVVRALTRP